MTRRTTGLVVGAATALLVAGCSGGSGQATSSSPAAPGVSPAAGASPGGTAAPTTAPTPAATQSLTPVPSKSRTTLAPAAPSRTVTVGAAARAALIKSRNVTITGQGPGELSGPGVALTLQVTNGGSTPLDLDAVTVSASIRGQEASSSDAAPAKPFGGRLAASAKAQAVYVFVLPAGARRPVGVVVSLAPDLPVARFTVP
jgi:ABC-type Fe3+-hydroxamate transport system substrate-binding protein